MYSHSYIDLNTQYLSSFMGMEIKSESELLNKIQEGLDVSALLELHKRLDLPQSIFLEAVHMSRTTYQRRKEEKILSQSESDAVVRIAQVYAHALSVFEQEAYVSEWLVKPLRTLSGKTPLQYASFERGAAYVHNLLSSLENGNFFA
jgi:putative toxin-antitoxin system antitoxin component (TIGR02293 family)